MTRREQARRAGARGYFGIGVDRPKTKVNVGTLWRSADIYGADFLFTVARRYQRQHSDTMHTARHTPLWQFDDMDALLDCVPDGAALVGVELTDEAVPLAEFTHPRRALYLLGAEDHGLSPATLARCDYVVRLPGEYSLNVAVAGSIVLYDRVTRGTSASVYPRGRS